MAHRLSRLWSDEGGAVAIEYALLIGLIALAIVSSVAQLAAPSVSPFEALAKGWGK